LYFWSVANEHQMPLQNRVTPSATSSPIRIGGLFTGNRGIIHDPAKRRFERTLVEPAWWSAL